MHQNLARNAKMVYYILCIDIFLFEANYRRKAAKTIY